jgi:cation diffusion facilitator family transporter
MKIFYKLFRQNPETREGIIATTSGIGILANLLISGAKIAIGLLSSSIAIVSEGVNNATDVLSSLLTLIGTKLAGKHPDEKHPFGHGRVEYLTSLTISVVIILTGFEMLKSSVDLIRHPAELKISYLALGIVAVSAVIKFFLGLYTIKMGKKADSRALVGVGVDCRNDSFASTVTIVSALAFLLFDVHIDAYAGFITSILIVKAGVDILGDTVSDLIGRPGEKELATKLYKEIRSTPGILNAADMMLHNYGPEAYSGSVNVELDHALTVEEAYQFIHALQLRIMREYDVMMVFGIYAVDNDHEESKQLRGYIKSFVKRQEHVKNFHAVYIEPVTNNIYCDLVVDYGLKDWDALREEFVSYMKKKYPESEIFLTIETEFV